MVVPGLKLPMCAFWKQSLWAPLQRSQPAQWKFNQILQVLCKVLPSLLQDSSGYCNCYFACEAQIQWSTEQPRAWPKVTQLTLGAKSCPWHLKHSSTWQTALTKAENIAQTMILALPVHSYTACDCVSLKTWAWNGVFCSMEHMQCIFLPPTHT